MNTLLKKQLRLYRFIALFGLIVTGPATSVFCAAEPSRRALKQDFNVIGAVPSREFAEVFFDLRDRIKGTLGVQSEARGPRAARFIVNVIRGVDGSESTFNTAHQEYMAGEWQSAENDPHITFKSVPEQYVAYLDQQLTEGSCRDLNVPQFRVLGFDVFRGINQPDRAYIVVQIVSCDLENDFETLAAQIDSMLPSVPREFDFKSHITLATIIPLPVARGKKSIITDDDIAGWKRQLNALWAQMGRENYNFIGTKCYDIDHLKVSYWAPSSEKAAQAHGIDMRTYEPRPERFLCRPGVLARPVTPPMPTRRVPAPPSMVPPIPTRPAPARPVTPPSAYMPVQPQVPHREPTFVFPTRQEIVSLMKGLRTNLNLIIEMRTLLLVFISGLQVGIDDAKRGDFRFSTERDIRRAIETSKRALAERSPLLLLDAMVHYIGSRKIVAKNERIVAKNERAKAIARMIDENSPAVLPDVEEMAHYALSDMGERPVEVPVPQIRRPQRPLIPESEIEEELSPETYELQKQFEEYGEYY